MRKSTRSILAASAALLVPGAALADTLAQPTAVIRNQSPELRAFWVDGFNDGYKTPEQCDHLIAHLRSLHCNAVFVQMRKRADAYYASHYEPWALDDPDHFDALAYVCKLAHEPGKPAIQVHAWINACAVGGNKSPESLTKRHPDWFSLSDAAADFDSESTKIDPGNPAAADWTYRVYMDVARHYDVDGIHLDFIRYGGSGKTVGHWGYNPVSVARFNAVTGHSGQPVWDDPKWQQWRRDQVYALVRRVSAGAHALKPKMIVSAATICWGAPPADDVAYEAKSAAYTQVYASWRDWLKDGLLDLNCPMTYFDTSRHPDWWNGWLTFVKTHQYDRLSAMGIGVWLNGIPQSMQQIADTRVPVEGRPAAGAVIFSYASTDTTNKVERQNTPEFYAALATPGLWDTDVATPGMPWLTAPTTGMVTGTLLSADLTPRDTVTVRIESADGGGIVRRATTDGNGHFAVLGVPPGKYAVAVEGQERIPVQVAAGSVSVVTPGLVGRKVAGIGSLPDGSAVTLSRALVTSGSGKAAEFCYVADAFGKWPVRLHMPAGSPPAVAGDIVAVRGRMSHEGSNPVIEADAMPLIDTVLIRPAAR